MSPSLQVFFSLKAVSRRRHGYVSTSLPDNCEDVLDVPSVFVNSSAPAGNYVVFMIDPTTDMGTFLHWFQPNLVADSNGNLTVDVTTQNASTAVGASYIYPQPPAENFAHLYVILLYQQPPNWAVPSNYSTINPPSDITARLGFDIADFQRASGLSDPIGTNFFRVLNGTAEQTSTIATATPTFTAASSSGSGATTASATSTTESATSTASGNAAAMNGGGTMSMATWAGIFGLPLFLF